MRVLIKDVIIGSEYDYTGEIGDFWIEVQLKSGKIIEIFDPDKFDLRNYINSEIDCLIWAILKKNSIFRVESGEKQTDPLQIYGKYNSKYQIESKWNNYEDESTISALETIDGTFLFNDDKINDKSVKEGEEIGLKIIRFDLLDYNLIEY